MALGYGAPGYEAAMGLGGEDESAIVQFLRSMMQRRQTPYGSDRGRMDPVYASELGFSGSPGDPSGGPSGAKAIANPPDTQPQYGPETKTEFGSMPQFFEQPPAAPPYEPPGGAPAPARAPLQFAWGGGKPQDYTPGQTDIYSQPGAPEFTQGFMPAGGIRAALAFQQVPGASGGVPLPMAQRQSAGGVGGQPWEDVANPIGMGGYEESIARAAADRERQNPLWKEQALQDIQVGGAKTLMQEQAGIAQAAHEKMMSEAITVSRQGALSGIVSDPIYQQAKPEQRKQMEQAAQDEAERQVRMSFGSSRTSYNLTPSIPARR